MPRIREKNKGAKTKREQPKKYKEKTLHQHCLDGIVKILAELSREDNVNYHIVGSSNQCSEIGSEDMVNVNGSCRVGFFTMDNKHHLGPSNDGYPVKYVFQGKVEKDTWNQAEIQIESHKVDGLDFMEGKFNKDGSEA